MLLIIGLFVMSRLLLLPWPQPGSDIAIYARYAQEQQESDRQGEAFYAAHARTGWQQVANERGPLVTSLEEYKDVEYPPLAVAFMRLPVLCLPGWPGGHELTRDAVDAYRSAYRLGMAVVDVGLFALVVVLTRRLFPGESSQEQAERLLAYIVSTSIVCHLLYDRLDLLQAGLVMLALVLLLGQLPFLWSFAALAVAINFKIAPAVLVPVWVLGSWPSGTPLAISRPGLLIALVARAGLLIGLTGMFFLPFYLAAGNGCLGFLAYHQARGIEYGSLYASLLLALRPFGNPVEIDSSYGSINLTSPLSPFLLSVAPWLAAALLLGAATLLGAHLRRLARQAEHLAPSQKRLAQLDPPAIVGHTLLLLMLFILSNKVFSPQYLVWVVPLVSLAPFPRTSRRLFLWAFALTCLLTTMVFPFLFQSDLLHRAGSQDAPLLMSLEKPTFRLTVVLAARNLLFLGLAAGLALHLLRRAQSYRVSTAGASGALQGPGKNEVSHAVSDTT